MVASLNAEEVGVGASRVQVAEALVEPPCQAAVGLEEVVHHTVLKEVPVDDVEDQVAVRRNQMVVLDDAVEDLEVGGRHKHQREAPVGAGEAAE